MLWAGGGSRGVVLWAGGDSRGVVLSTTGAFLECVLPAAVVSGTGVKPMPAISVFSVSLTTGICVGSVF